MGATTFSIDQNLVEALQRALPLRVFVESGTFRGDTVGSMQELFEQLHSIELSEDLFQQASVRFAEQPTVTLHHGPSPEILPNLVAQLKDQSVLYWLDAHWCESEGTAGALSQCPLLDELKLIGQLNDQTVLLIDDARYFLSPPPPPNEGSQWPRFQQVLDGLLALSDQHELMVINDVIACYPKSAIPAMERYANEHGTDLLEIASKARNFPELRRGSDAKDREITRLSKCEKELRQSSDAKDREITRLTKCENELRQASDAKALEIARLAKCEKELHERCQINEDEIKRLREILATPGQTETQ